MDRSIVLRGAQRKALLGYYRGSPDPQVRLRAQIILLLADGHAWSLICAVLFCSTRTIARWRDRFEAGGVAALLEDGRGRKARLGGAFGIWVLTVVRWVRTLTPRSFGYCRSRWCCATLALVLWQAYRVRVSRETVRRWLHREGIVWRRPRPVLGRKDPKKSQKLRHLRELLETLPADEVAVWEDEVDVNTNPEIGCMWMPKGRQAKVVTPGTNQKKYVAGSLNWRTGKLIATAGDKRDAALFLAHLDDLRRKLRRYRKVHVICDNARFRNPEQCRAVKRYLAKWGHRIALHFLPRYAPETNPVERVWWHLREQITRNHKCGGMRELLDLVFRWLEQKDTFQIEGHLYPRPKKAKEPKKAQEPKKARAA